MRPVSVSVTGVGVSAPIPQDTYIAPFELGIGVAVSGSVTYSVEHTFDDIFAANYNPAFGTWFASPTIVSKNGDFYGSYNFPVSAVRLAVSSGTGTATMKVIQSGVVGG